MRLNFIPVAFAACILFVLSSCQKEVSVELGNSGNGNGNGNGGNNSTTNIEGEYDFVGSFAKTKSVATVTMLGQTEMAITTCDYFTENNVGRAKITSNEMMSINIGYTVDTTVRMVSYINGTLDSEDEFPAFFNVPATSNTSTYVRVSNDSLRVTGALGYTADPNQPGSASASTTGMKLRWSGDTLILKVSASDSFIDNSLGFPMNVQATVTAETKLKKRP